VQRPAAAAADQRAAALSDGISARLCENQP